MLVHDRFVFIHNQKCGGVFIRKLLARELGPTALEEPFAIRHVGGNRIPEQAEGLSVLCYVRNPWDWYVSWYEFKRQRPAPDGDPIFDAFSNGGRNGFAGTIAAACAGSPSIGAGADLYSGSFSYAVGGVPPELLTVGRFESLVDDLDAFLTHVGVELPAGAIERAQSCPPANATTRRPYRDYYDDSLRDMVGESCQELIARFGYTF